MKPTPTLPARGLARASVLLLAASLAMTPPAAFAETIAWDGGGADNLWTTPENWSGDVVPGREDDVVFDGTSTKDCLVENLSPEVGALTVAMEYTGTLAFGANAHATLRGDFTQRGGTVDWGGVDFANHHVFHRSFDSERDCSAHGAELQFRSERFDDPPRRLHSLYELSVLDLTFVTADRGNLSIAMSGEFYLRNGLRATNNDGSSATLGLNTQLAVGGRLELRKSGGVRPLFQVGAEAPGTMTTVFLPDVAVIADWIGNDPRYANGGRVVRLGNSYPATAANGLRFVDGSGDDTFDLIGAPSFLRLFDGDANLDGTVLDTIQVAVYAFDAGDVPPDSDDQLNVFLVETAPASGEFRAPFPSFELGVPANRADDVLQVPYGSSVVGVRYIDNGVTEVTYQLSLETATPSGAMAR